MIGQKYPSGEQELLSGAYRVQGSREDGKVQFVEKLAALQ